MLGLSAAATAVDYYLVGFLMESDYSSLPPEMFYKKAVLKNFAISTGNTFIGLYF